MKKHFTTQFPDLNNDKLARRERFARKVQQKLHYRAAIERYKAHKLFIEPRQQSLH